MMKARKGETISYRDFPPTDEDEKTISWNMPGLNIDMKKGGHTRCYNQN